MHIPMLNNSIIKAGIDFLKGSLTFKCIQIAPIIKSETTIAVGKTKEVNHIPKRSKTAEPILMIPIE